jgi:hypothetical protein
VKFAITIHSGFGAPSDALERLWERLGARRADAYFSKGYAEIRASYGEDLPVSMERDQQAEIGREAVLEIVRDVCDGAAELKFDWYAIRALQ